MNKLSVEKHPLTMTDNSSNPLRDKFLGGMSYAACTVNIITTDGDAGRSGVTVSAMTSVSADTAKPTLLVCVHHLSPAADKIIKNKVFCVNILRDDQSYISDSFAGRFKDQLDDKFNCTDWENMPSGSPRIIDPLVGFDCKVLSSERVGTHHVFLGEVNDIFISKKGSPLIYANRAYGVASPIEAISSIASGKAAAEHHLSIGCFYTFAPYILPKIFQKMLQLNPSLSFDLIEGDQRRVQESLMAGKIDLALLYDFNLPDCFNSTRLTALDPYILLAEHHPLSKKKTLTPDDLKEFPMILLDSSPSRDYFKNILYSAGVTPDIAFKSSSFEMVRGMVGHGLGYTLLATKPASSMTYDGLALISRPLAIKTEPSWIILATHKNKIPSASAQQFIDFLYDFFHASSKKTENFLN